MKKILTILVTTLVFGAAQAAPLLDMENGPLRFTLGPGNQHKLTAHGVPVYRSASLYMTFPNWQHVVLNQDAMTPKVTASNANGVKMGDAVYENDEGYARYQFELKPSAFTVDLLYRSKVNAPREIEVDAAYLNANLIKARPFTADTVEGPRSGFVPLYAKTDDQEASRLSPFIKSATFDSAIGRINIGVQGNREETSSLNIFDARKDPHEWGNNTPVFWVGMGSPVRPLQKGDNRLKVTWSFGAPPPRPAAVKAAAPKLVPLKSATVPHGIELPLIPTPKDQSNAGADFVLNNLTRIIIPDAATAEEKQAAQELKSELGEFWNIKATVLTEKAAKAMKRPGCRDIVLCRQGVVKHAAFIGSMKPSVPASKEGYWLGVRNSGILVSGYDARGVYWGAQTLKQLLRTGAKGVYVKAKTVTDWPSLGFRGVHWFGGPGSYPFHKKMIERIVSPLKMNAMVYQADYTQWDSQPKVWSQERSTPKADVRKSVALARQHFMEPIPMVNGMGHAEWLFWNGQNLDIAADPTQPYAYDPTKSKSYDVLFRIYEEAIDLFKPRYFHIGNDEVTMTGKFPPAGSNKTVTELVLADTNKRHDWLKARGLETMMWGDMFLHRSEANDAAHALTPEDSAARRAGIPKDIIITDWHYTGTDPNYKSVPILQKEGFRIIGTPWYNWNNIANWAVALSANKSMGFLQSTWAGYNMDLGIVKGDSAMQFVAYLLAADYAWNGGTPALQDMKYNPDEAFWSLWDRKPVSQRTRTGWAMDLAASANADLWDWTRLLPGAKKVGQNPTKPLSGQVTRQGTVFQVGRPVWMSGPLNPDGVWPESLKIPFGNRKVSEIHWLWGTTNATERKTPVATVVVEYADGETATAPVRYGEQIFAFDDQSTGAYTTIVWDGTNPYGEKVSCRRWIWENPRPGFAIKSVTVTSSQTEAAPVILAATAVS